MYIESAHSGFLLRWYWVGLRARRERKPMTHEILIVEEHPRGDRSKRDLLERAGYEVHEVPSMGRALRSARHTPPLAILVEVPEEGDAPARFTERLRRDPKTSSVPVILLRQGTGDGFPSKEIVGITWLAEPCPPRTLLEEVAYLTRSCRG
jgi:CheY-like chemotaxis protein